MRLVMLGWTLVALVAASPAAASSPGGAVSGVVVDAQTGAPVASGRVSVQRLDPLEEFPEQVAFADLTADGKYRVTGVPPGAYRVVAEGYDAATFTEYAEKAWPDAPEVYTGADVEVTAAERTGIDFALDRTGELHGRVTDAATGAPLPSSQVTAEPVGRTGYTIALEAGSDGAGRWAIGGVPPGAYRLRFSAGYLQPGERGHADQWAFARSSRASADHVVVSAGAARRGVDAMMAPASSVSGAVTDAETGAPVPGICVTAHDASGSAIEPGENEFEAVTDVAGAWRVRPLATGVYRFAYTDCSPAPVGPGAAFDTGYLPRPFTDGPPVTVGTAPVEGLTQQLDRGGAIRGVVTRAGRRVPNACVAAVDADGGVVATRRTVAAADSDPANGGYVLGSLPPGAYRVRVTERCEDDEPTREPLSAAPAWYTNAETAATARPVAVRTGELTPDVDLALDRPGAAVEGRVVDVGTGHPVRGLCVQIRPAGHPLEPPVSTRTTAAEGWRVTGTPAGELTVTAVDCAPDSLTSYAPATTTVTVTEGGERADVELAVGERVTRAAGPSRVETAVEISRLVFETAPAVVLARADDYPDALAGAPLAARAGGPLLLSSTDALPAAVAAEIRRLGARTAYLLGSADALATSVEAAARAAGVDDVVRIGGATRYETAALIAEHIGGDGAYVAEGGNADPARGWPDAVAVSGLAAAQGRPLLLVERDRLPEATHTALEGRASATIAGDEAAVSSAVADAIAGADVRVDRLAGATRYGTSAAVAAASVAAGLDAGRLWLATGRNWPDALAAGTAAAAQGGVLLLVDGFAASGAPEALAFLDASGTALDRAVLTGSTDVLTPDVEAALRSRLP